MVATLSTLQTNLDFPTLLEAIKDPLPASKIVDAFYGYLADPVQADQMLSTSRWMGLGVLMEVALRHGSLRKQIVETYFRLLRWGYESKLSPLNLVGDSVRTEEGTFLTQVSNADAVKKKVCRGIGFAHDTRQRHGKPGNELDNFEGFEFVGRRVGGFSLRLLHRMNVLVG